MRCSCCDKVMNEKEIQWDKERQEWELCSVCLDIALDAAYSDGFQNSDEGGHDGIVLVGEESFDDALDFQSYNDYVPLGYTLTEEGYYGDD